MLTRFALVVMIVGSEKDAFNFFVNNQKASIKKTKFHENKPFFFRL